MSAAVLRNAFIRCLQSRVAKAFFKWISFAQDAMPLSDIVYMKDTLEEQSVSLVELEASLELAKKKIYELQEANGVAFGEAEFSSKRLAEIEAKLQDGKSLLMFKWIKQIVMSKLRSGFSTWTRYSFGKRRYLALVGRAARRLRHRVAAKAFFGWRDNVREIRRRKAMLRKALGMLKNRLLGKAYLGWKDNVAEKGQWDKNIFLSLHKLSLTKSFLQNEQLDTILHFHDNTVRKRALVARAAGRLKYRVAGKAFAKWRFEIAEKKRRRNLMVRTKARWSMRTQAAAFLGWKDKVDSVRRTREILKRSGAKWMHRRLAKAYFRWAEMVAEKKRMRFVSQKAARRWVNRTLSVRI